MADTDTTTPPAVDDSAVPGWHDAAVDADYWFEVFSRARTPLEAADALVRLRDAMADLRSWLPGFDPRTGTMPWEREDAEQG